MKTIGIDFFNVNKFTVNIFYKIIRRAQHGVFCYLKKINIKKKRIHKQKT
jgi:hypothetical protein